MNGYSSNGQFEREQGVQMATEYQNELPAILSA